MERANSERANSSNDKLRYDSKAPSPSFERDHNIDKSDDEMWLCTVPNSGVLMLPMAGESHLATPAPAPALPPHRTAPQSTADEFKLTESEQKRFNKLCYNIYNIDPKKPTDRRIFWKMNAEHAGEYDDLKAIVQNFEPHPDTAFMLSGPKYSIPVPKPAPEYLDLANADFTRLPEGQPMLLILDLNGTLLYRPDRKRSHHFIRRQNLKYFLKYVFETFGVMIWTTAQPGNAAAMRDSMLNRSQKMNLVDTWDRMSFNLNADQYGEKTTVYKRLEWVWSSETIQCYHPWYAHGWRWDQTNTILLDDSVVKATAQPYNHILVPEFSGADSDIHVKRGSVLEQVAGYLEVARAQSNVSAYMKTNPFKVDETGYFKPLGPQHKPAVIRKVEQKELDPTREMFPGMGTW